MSVSVIGGWVCERECYRWVCERECYRFVGGCVSVSAIDGWVGV